MKQILSSFFFFFFSSCFLLVPIPFQYCSLNLDFQTVLLDIRKTSSQSSAVSCYICFRDHVQSREVSFTRVSIWPVAKPHSTIRGQLECCICGCEEGEWRSQRINEYSLARKRIEIIQALRIPTTCDHPKVQSGCSSLHGVGVYRGLI